MEATNSQAASEAKSKDGIEFSQDYKPGKFQCQL